MFQRDLLLFGMRLVLGAYPVWKGCAPSTRQRVYFANHTSNADTVVLMAALPLECRVHIHPVAAKDYWGNGRVRQYIARRVLNVVLIDRKREEKQNPLIPLKEQLDQGESLIIFPEGQRNVGEEPGPFKSGLYNLAKEYAHVEFVPVYLENVHRIMPKGKVLPLPLISKAYFGAPLVLADDEPREDFLERARQAVIALKGTRT